MPIKVRLVLYSNGFGFKGWSQNKHEKDLLFSWILEMWIFRFPIWLNTFLQCGHFIFHVWVQLLWWYNIFFLFVTSLTFCTNPRFDFIMNNHTMLSQIIFFGKFLHIFCNRKFGKNESANVFVDCCHMIFKRGFSVSPHFDSDLSIFAI